MRTIRFRGKRVDNGEWVYGNHHTDEAGKYSFILIPWVTSWHPNTQDMKVAGYNVDPATVGQFTGLQDKNGKDIYEGDKVYSGWTDDSSQVVYGEWITPEGELVHGFFAGDCSLLGVEADKPWPEVIGNIHDKESE